MQRSIEMSEIPIEMATAEDMVLTVLTYLKETERSTTRRPVLPRSSDSKTTGLDWSLETKSAWPSSFRRHGNSTQTLRCRLTQFS